MTSAEESPNAKMTDAEKPKVAPHMRYVLSRCLLNSLTNVLPSAVALEGPSAIVIIQVGPEHRRYYLHKAFLIHYSEYFRKALSGPWKEAEEGVIPLEDIEPGVCK